MTKRNKIIIYILTAIFIITLMGSIFTRKRVYENKSYYDRDHIALYIYEYDKLPINFITKDSSSNSYYKGDKSNVYENGYNIGGDNFRYEGAITSLTKNTRLKECDYYPDRDTVIAENNRGTYRLVYNVYGKEEVFYTEDHYTTFTKLSKFEINMTSNVFRILSVLCLIGDGAYIVYIFKPRIIKSKDNYIEADIVE